MFACGSYRRNSRMEEKEKERPHAPSRLHPEFCTASREGGNSGKFVSGAVKRKRRSRKGSRRGFGGHGQDLKGERVWTGQTGPLGRLSNRELRMLARVGPQLPCSHSAIWPSPAPDARWITADDPCRYSGRVRCRTIRLLLYLSCHLSSIRASGLPHLCLPRGPGRAHLSTHVINTMETGRKRIPLQHFHLH